jgi:hypothetical protein
MPPPDSFLQQDAPDLAPLHLDALVVCRSRQGIQTPLGVLLGLAGTEFVAHPLGPPRRRRARQSDDRPALVLGEPRLPSCSRAITQAIDAFRIEPNEPFSHGLRMAVELLGKRSGALALPAADNHPSAQNPIGWGMTTPCQLADLALFLLIARWSSEQQLGHSDLL